MNLATLWLLISMETFMLPVRLCHRIFLRLPTPMIVHLMVLGILVVMVLYPSLMEN